MGVEVKRVMEKDKKGVYRQIYPQSHISAIEGLEKFMEEGQLVVGVESVNGQTGVVHLTAANLGLTAEGLPLASETQDGMLTAEMYKQLKALLESPPGSGGISLEKVEK